MKEDVDEVPKFSNPKEEPNAEDWPSIVYVTLES